MTMITDNKWHRQASNILNSYRHGVALYDECWAQIAIHRITGSWTRAQCAIALGALNSIT